MGATGAPAGGGRTWSTAAAAFAFSLAGSALLFAAQLGLDGGHLSARTAVVGSCGLAAWAYALWRCPVASHRTGGATPAAAVRLYPFAVAVFAGVCTWHLSADGAYTRWNLVTWAIAIACWLWAFWAPETLRRGGRSWRRAHGRKAWTAVAVLAILAAATFFRYYHLAQVPHEPTSDHAEKLLDIADIRHGSNPVFFTRNTGREPLQFYVTAGLVDAGMAPTFETLKVGTAFVGVLGVLAVLLLGWEFAGRAAGLLAGALVAVAQWPVAVSRTGLRHTYGLTMAAFALWLLLRYLRTRSRRDLLLLGVTLAVGLHGYTAFRIVPVVAAAAVATAWIRRGRRLLAEVGILIGTVAVATVPLLRYAVDHPDLFWYRTLRRVGGTEAPVGGFGHGFGTFVANVWHSLLAFNWRGDSGLVTLVRFDPFLDAVAGAAFLAGLLVLAQRIVRGRDGRAVALAAALPALTLSSTLNLAFPRENPSATRMGPVAPVVFVVAALALAYVVARLTALPHRLVARAAAALLVAGAIAVAAVDDYRSFFHDFDRQYRTTVPNTSEAVAAITGTGVRRERAFMLPFDYWIDPRNVGAELGDIGWAETNVVDAAGPLPASHGRNLVFLLNVADRAGRSRLSATYPEGAYRRVRSAVGKDFALYVVGGRVT